MFLVIPLFFLFLFTVIPIASLFQLSFTSYDGISSPRWVGLDNYVKILTRDEVFKLSLKNVFLYLIALYLPIVNLVGLSFALFLNSTTRKVRSLFATIFYIPEVTAPVAIALVWAFIFSPHYGILNSVLTKIGLPPQPWLTEPSTAMPSVVLMLVWKHAGWYMIIWFAGLQGIPEYLYEVAKIDGAGKLSRFLNITLPSMRPVILFIVIIGIIAVFQIFGEIYVMTFGGPAGATQVPVYQIYLQGFRNWRLGYAAAQSALLFAIVFFLSILNLKFGRGYYVE